MATTATDFPIPADLEGFWQWDQLHCPRPLTVLEHELLLASTGWGFSKAIAELGSGLKAVTKSINGYNYLSGVPLDLGEDDPQARAERYHQNVDALLQVLGQRRETSGCRRSSRPSVSASARTTRRSSKPNFSV